MKIENAKKMPLVLYGLHFAHGVAEYADPGETPYRILINEDVAKRMDPTFVGKPLYVEHVDGVDLDTIEQDADGWVIESFYNQLDGKHWVKFILTTDRAQSAYRLGYKLSNAYNPQLVMKTGQWHGVAYQKEVVGGEYEHLALVQEPRYAESLILTPEEFKEYNLQKESELKRLENSKEEKRPMKFPIFKRTKVENTKDVDFDNLEVTLPKSKQTVSLTECIEGFDTLQNMSGYANMDHMVKLNDKDECSVADLMKKHNDLEKELTAMKEKNAGGGMDEMADIDSMDNGDGVGVEEDDEDLGVDPGADLTKKNARVQKKAPVKNSEEDEEVEEKQVTRNAKSENFKKLKNAESRALQNEGPELLLSSDKMKLGQKRYGSN